MTASSDPIFQLPFVESSNTVRVAEIDLFVQHVTPQSPWASLVIVHGYGDHSGRHQHVMRWMARHGVACHALDLRGQGRSTGRPGYVDRWEDYLDDLSAILGQADIVATGRPFILGHSHGGLIVAAAVERGLVDARGCVLTSPYFGPRFKVPRHKPLLARLFNPIVPWLRVSSGLGEEMLTTDPVMRAAGREDPLSRRFATPRWYLGSLKAQERVLADAERFTPPLLLLFGGEDGIADEQTARKFFDSAGSHDKKITIYPGLLHEILRETIREEIFGDILEWMKTRTARA
jgi:lysophospholipase